MTDLLLTKQVADLSLGSNLNICQLCCAGAKFNEGTWSFRDIDTSRLQFAVPHNGSLASMKGVRFPRPTMVDDPNWPSKRRLFSCQHHDLPPHSYGVNRFRTLHATVRLGRSREWSMENGELKIEN